MPIDVVCPGCAKTFRAPDSAAGRKGRCKTCGTLVTIPTPDDPPASAMPPLSLDPDDEPSGWVAAVVDDELAAEPPSVFAPAFSPRPSKSPASSALPPEPSALRVVVVDVRIPFGSMIDLVLRFAVASLIVSLLLAVVVGIAVGIFGLIIRAMLVGS